MSTQSSTVGASLARVDASIECNPIAVIGEALQWFEPAECSRLLVLLGEWTATAQENPNDAICCPLRDVLSDIALAVLGGEGASYERAA